MDETQFNPQETMTRKEYLKMRKKKNKRKKSKITYVLITCLLLLSVYVFSQLYVYSANKNIQYNPGDKVYEDYYDIYYSIPTYTYNIKHDLVSVSAEGIEKKLLISDGFSNIQKIENKIYGIKDKKIFSYDIETGTTALILGDDNLVIDKFIIDKNVIYLVSGKAGEGKLQTAELDGKNLKEIYNKYAYQLYVDGNAVYVIANEKSNYNLIKINTFDNSNSVMISDKVVNNIYVIEDYVYFSNGSDDKKLYKINKEKFEDVSKVSDIPVVFDKEFTNINGGYAILGYKGDIYFIANTDGNKLCVVGINNEKTDTVLDIQVEKMRLKDRYIFYTVKDELGLFSYNIETKDLRKVTEKRFSEFAF